jgi:peptidoglycan/LPS O-acetylase OafA/YrhL
MIENPKVLPGLHAIRGLAALAVLVHHVNFCAEKQFADPAFPIGVALGWFGVDVFFVLSGFIMAYTTMKTERRGAAVGRFVVARAGRIYPPYWAAVGLMAFLTWLFPTFLRLNASGAWVYDLLLLPAAQAPALGRAWTLIFEVSCYALFAVLLLAAAQRRLLLVVLWAGAVISAALLLEGPKNPLIGVVANPLVLEFLAGAVIAHVVARGARIGALPAFVIGAAGLMIGA